MRPADDEAERISLSKLDPVEALKALLAVKPESSEDEERQDDERPRARGGSDAENDA